MYMKYTQKRILAISILGIPFILSIGISSFGGVGLDGSFYPLFIGTLLWGGGFFFQRTIKVPKTSSFFMLCLFLMVSFASGIVNFFSLSHIQFQGIFGVNRFIIQWLALLFYFIVALYTYNVCRSSIREPLCFLEKMILLSFVIPMIYSFFELMRFMGGDWSTVVLAQMDSLFRANDSFYPRMRSVASEPSAFGMYSAVLFPWLLTAVLNAVGARRFVLSGVLLYFLGLAFLTASRTTYVILGVEGLLYALLFRMDLVRNRSLIFGLFVGGGAFLTAIILGAEREINVDVLAIYQSLFFDDGIHDLSNVARYGSTISALHIWRDFPVLGCGLGGYGFYAADYYPNWAWQSIEIVNWSLNTPYGAGWPPVHNIYARILAEMGAIGLFAYICILFSLLKEEWALLNSHAEKKYVKNLIITTIGVVLCGFNGDLFHLFIFWIILGIVWCCKTLEKMRTGEMDLC